MKKITRRDFLNRSALGMGSVVLASQFPLSPGEAEKSLKPKKMPLGFQAWTVRNSLVKDFPGTLKNIAGMGYKSIEMCSPPGYQFAGFGPLMNLTAKEMKQIINDAGLICSSCHYGMDELRKNLDERVAFALEVGQTQMILSSFGLPGKATMDDWKKAADELNEIGLKAKNGGIQMGFHNHHMEFAQIDGTLIYDVLLNQFDPEYIKMQFQVAVITIGYKASDYFNKYPGRFISAHLADFSTDKTTEAPVGQGIVDWKEFFASIKKGGVKNIFVEMEENTFKDSAAYLLNT
ncbi:MAG: sugar phosphate isomerase/epimerase [Bacteroidia bacterium]|nr:sugar phosphate isomerase/epimerase [Bacteroidia bacterium]